MRLLIRRPWTGWFTILTVLSFTIGTGLTEQGNDLMPRVPPDQLSQAQSLHNPYAVTPESVASGKAIYVGKAFCSACHGVEVSGAHGNSGPSSSAYPSPRNFGDAAWQAARTDGEIFWILKHGSHGTDMAPYLPLYLTDEEAWQIVMYIRTFGKS